MPDYDEHQLNEDHKEHHVHHPAFLPYIFTIVLTALVVTFGFVTVFIPWAWKDLAVGQRAYAYPFKTCIEDTFSIVNQETCLDNDFIEPQGVGLTGENSSCKAYILATIAFVFLSVLPGVLLLILLGYILEHLWWHPLIAAGFANLILIWICIACFLAWIFFIVYMEKTCAPNSIFPVSPGYSYGWIMYLFNSIFSLLAIATGIWGTKRIYNYKVKSYLYREMAEGHYPANVVPEHHHGEWIAPAYDWHLHHHHQGKKTEAAEAHPHQNMQSPLPYPGTSTPAPVYSPPAMYSSPPAATFSPAGANAGWGWNYPYL